MKECKKKECNAMKMYRWKYDGKENMYIFIKYMGMILGVKTINNKLI